jgi:hypothetical protein
MSLAVHPAPRRAEAEVDLERSVAALQDEVHGLRVAMATRAPIEQAKGMLMSRYGIDEDEAFVLLRTWSSAHNVKLRLIAAALMEVCVTDHARASSDPTEDGLLAAALARPSRIEALAGRTVVRR